MKILNGTAIYTGGGFYTVLGRIDNGLYFCGTNEWCSVYDMDTRTENEDGDLVCFEEEWCEKHDKSSEFDYKEIVKMFKNFCLRLDQEEDGITNGYEDLSNYGLNVIKAIDFDYMFEVAKKEKRHKKSEEKRKYRLVKFSARMTQELEVIITNAPDPVIEANLKYISCLREEGETIKNPYEVIEAMGYKAICVGSQDDFDTDDLKEMDIQAEFDYYDY